MGGEKGSEFSVGGMKTKLLSAKSCYSHGVMMAILDGSNPIFIYCEHFNKREYVVVC